jgi:hypothetical protein
VTTNDNNKTQGKRDTGFGCPHYDAFPGKKRCRHYQDGGSCDRPDAVKCVEWLRLNEKTKPAPKPQGPTDLFGEPIPEPKPKRPKRTRATQQWRRPTAARLSPPPVIDEPIPVREPLRGLTTDDIDGFKALGVEVCLESDAFGSVWLVPEYSEADRKEIIPEHAATIVRVMEAFPGSKVVSFQKSPQQGKESV